MNLKKCITKDNQPHLITERFYTFHIHRNLSGTKEKKGL